jgi:hypothetical protein
MAFIFQVTLMGQLSKGPNQSQKGEKKFQETNFVNKYQLWASYPSEPPPP